MLANHLTAAGRMHHADRFYRQLRQLATKGVASSAELLARGDRVCNRTLHELGAVDNCIEVHLVVQYYRPGSTNRGGGASEAADERALEIAWCLHQNLRNPLIAHVHVLSEKPQVRPSARVCASLVLQRCFGSISRRTHLFLLT